MVIQNNKSQQLVNLVIGYATVVLVRSALGSIVKDRRDHGDGGQARGHGGGRGRSRDNSDECGRSGLSTTDNDKLHCT